MTKLAPLELKSTFPDSAVQPDGREPAPAKFVSKDEARAGSDGHLAIDGQSIHCFIQCIRECSLSRGLQDVVSCAPVNGKTAASSVKATCRRSCMIVEVQMLEYE